MSINVRVHNQDGKWFEMNRACFGFLSYIDQWDSSDIQSASHGDIGEDDCYDEGITGFESDNLSSVDYLVTPFSGRSLPEKRSSKLSEAIKEAVADLPQYYGGVTIKEVGSRWEVNFPLEREQMAPMVISGMMLRNALQYTGVGLAFEKFLEYGLTPAQAFAMSQAYSFSNNVLDQSKCYFYRIRSGDESIFGEKARLCDIVAMINGEIGNDWQGAFGDTENGYGRYGEYDNNDNAAPDNERTGMKCHLNDVVLIKEGYNDSPLLSDRSFCSVENNEYGSNQITQETMTGVVIPALMEALKSGS